MSSKGIEGLSTRSRTRRGLREKDIPIPPSSISPTSSLEEGHKTSPGHTAHHRNEATRDVSHPSENTSYRSNSPENPKYCEVEEPGTGKGSGQLTDAHNVAGNQKDNSSSTGPVEDTLEESFQFLSDLHQNKLDYNSVGPCKKFSLDQPSFESLLRRIEDKPDLSAFLHAKHTLEYFQPERILRIKMPNLEHNIPIKLTTERIMSKVQAIIRQHIRQASLNLECHLDSEIRLLRDDEDDQRREDQCELYRLEMLLEKATTVEAIAKAQADLDKHQKCLDRHLREHKGTPRRPDAQFFFNAPIFNQTEFELQTLPCLVIEIAVSQDSPSVNRVTEEYILYSGNTIKVAVALDLHCSRKNEPITDKSAEVRVFRQKITRTEDVNIIGKTKDSDMKICGKTGSICGPPEEPVISLTLRDFFLNDEWFKAYEAGGDAVDTLDIPIDITRQELLDDITEGRRRQALLISGKRVMAETKEDSRKRVRRTYEEPSDNGDASIRPAGRGFHGSPVDFKTRPAGPRCAA